MPSSKSPKQSPQRSPKAPKLVKVRTTIPPHVANALMEATHTSTPQEAVERVVSLLKQPKPRKEDAEDGRLAAEAHRNAKRRKDTTPLDQIKRDLGLL